MSKENNESVIVFEELKLQLQQKTKKGVDFIFAASVTWLLISGIWIFTINTAYEKSVFTFVIGAALLPLALGFSKIFKTQWKIKVNPLQPLGLWLNFAQLIYFPFLIFMLVKYPDYFIMSYAIITGAHLFPYGWLYDEIGYAIIGIIIAFGAMLLALFDYNSSIITIFTSIMLLVLGILILYRIQNIINENT
ncbi:MAG: hypothetical protein V3575_06085 [Candidatus Absconditabacteria bacterium]